ncbi:genetic competence negative regulator [Bacillus sp. 03113]|uniref:genetic competence negative regulator n=1 Tax=Bacillus sp. 03113 TaxID=2578211 RepID=UPI00114272AF|nr:genetic competence negative regulator [Bacillus sp. 03113]
MRLERLNYNKIKIFLTIDDLHERGLTKEDIWKDSLKWHQLFHDMLEEANEEFGVDFQGSVAVEIFSMQAQGMIMIVTMEEPEEETLSDGFIEMQVTLEKNTDILFEFFEFEDVIQAAKQLSCIHYSDGCLYKMNESYFLFIEHLSTGKENQIFAILSEFGNPSFLSIHCLQEYGVEIINSEAVKTINHFFH